MSRWHFGRALVIPIGAVVFSWTLHARPVAPAGLAPALILHSGKILTVNATFDIVQAVAVREGRIVALGPNTAIRAMATEGTRSVDSGGRTVVPGFIDAHAHPTSDGSVVFRVDLSGTTSISDIVARVAGEVKKLPAGDWVINSRYWSDTSLAEKRSPTRFDLDAVSPEHPVYLNRGHLGVVNTAALKRLGISDKVEDPPGGRFERDPQSGMLTGRLYETALELVEALIPPPTIEQLMDAQRHSFREMVAAGVTSFRAAGETPEAMRALIELRRRAELPVRASVMIRLNPNRPIRELEDQLKRTPASSGVGDDMLSLWGIKLVADGGSDLAYLRREYVSRPGFRGQLGGSPEAFAAIAKLCNQYGWRLGVHALGDGAIDMVLDAFDAADRERPIAAKRWAIEHGYLLQPEHYGRLKRLGIVLVPQTRHFYFLRQSFLTHYGESYANSTHPYRTLLKENIPIAGGADWPLAPSDNFFYMWAAISRTTMNGDIVGTEQALSREEALRFHTIWSAYLTFDENQKGSLEQGKVADLVVLSDDYLTVPENKIRSIRPILTLTAGRVVFNDHSLKTD